MKYVNVSGMHIKDWGFYVVPFDILFPLVAPGRKARGVKLYYRSSG